MWRWLEVILVFGNFVEFVWFVHREEHASCEFMSEALATSLQMSKNELASSFLLS